MESFFIYNCLVIIAFKAKLFVIEYCAKRENCTWVVPAGLGVDDMIEYQRKNPEGMILL
jgi:hypothetical protein